MSEATIFGTAALGSSAGYGTTGSSGDTGIFGTKFRVNDTLTGVTVDGIRIYAPAGSSLSGLWGYLISSDGATVMAAKQFGAITAGAWNEVLFDTPVDIVETNAFGWIAAVYLPSGGYTYKAHVFDSQVDSVDDPGNLFALPSTNGVFLSGAQSTPATPTLGSFGSFNSTHYGIDVVINDPTLGGGGSSPANTTAPHITSDGTPQTGETVTCSDGVWTGSPTPTLSKQWKRNGVNISGAGATSYVLQVADVGQTITCVVTATNIGGSASQASDNSIVPSAPPSGSPTNTVAPSISPGSGVHTGDTLTVSAGTWTGSPTGYSFQQQRDTGSGYANVGSPLADADGSITFVPQPADEGFPIRFMVTAANGSGSSSPTASNAVTPSATSSTGDTTFILVDGQWVALGGGGSAGLRVIHEAGVRPEDFSQYGTIGDGEDAVVIEGAIFEAALAAMNNGSFMAEVFLDPTRVYEVTRAPVAGGTVAGLPRLGFSQIAVPAFEPEDGQGPTIRLTGFGEASCNHWAQPVSRRSGARILSNLGAGSIDGTYGIASVIGSPTVQVGTNPLAPWYSNVLFVLDGVTVTLPQDPDTVIGVDMRGVGQFVVRRSLVNVDATSAELSASMPTPRNDGIGVYFPSPGNNAVLDAPEITVQGGAGTSTPA
jgi:hypothetical protein